MDVNIALLAGDGIGPEIIAEATKVLDRVAAKFGHRFDYREALVGACAIDATGDPYPDETHAICQAADAVLFGAIGDPKYDNDPKAPVRPEQGLLRMRKSLGLFANLRPIALFDTLAGRSPLKAEVVRGTDFIVEDAEPAEWEARLQLMLTAQGHATITGGSIVVDEAAYAASVNGRPLDLTYTEFELLKYLISHPGRVHTREKLLAEVWGYDYFGDVRTVDVTVHRLREKIEDNPVRPKILVTRRGVGYFVKQQTEK